MSVFTRVTSTLAMLAAATLLAGCERPPVDSVQSGYRGTGMVQVYNPRTVATQVPLNQPPPALPTGAPEGPKAKDIYQNVKVLGDLSVGQFTAQMVAITAWVSPKEGCNYCHNPANLADDSKYTKVVARRMIEMTQHVNVDWKNHVANTGVTCYTCHRGEPVPSQTWYQPLAQDKRADFMGNKNGQNTPLPAVNLSSLPSDPVTPYLKEQTTIRVAGTTALPSDHVASIQATEGTYALMVHMSQSLGVNCTFCHNTRSFGNWQESSPQRTTAWHGIRMAGDLNRNYLDPLGDTLPVTRKGPNGDTPGVSCATCHQGAYKPVYGAGMAKDWPGLLSTGAPKAAGLPPPMVEATRSVLFFELGSPALQDSQAAGLAALVTELKAKPAAKISISGYHSAAGALAQNQELAKQRAFAVRDSLVASGIAATRVTLEKPQQTAANVAGEDPTSRRVEVMVK